MAEGREISGFWNLDLLGEVVTFHNGEQEYDCVITRCNVYTGIDKQHAITNMLLFEGIKKMLPDVDNTQDAINTYMGFGDNVDHRFGVFFIDVISDLRQYTK